MTPQEVKLWNWLREAIVPTGFHLRRQVPIDCFIVDFACQRAKLVIEVDGEQHGLAPGLLRDEARDRRLAELGYETLRFSNRQVDREKQVVLETIYARLVPRCGVHPTPLALRASRPSPRRGEGSGGDVPERQDA